MASRGLGAAVARNTGLRCRPVLASAQLRCLCSSGASRESTTAKSSGEGAAASPPTPPPSSEGATKAPPPPEGASPLPDQAPEGVAYGDPNSNSIALADHEGDNLPPLEWEPGVAGAAQKGVSAIVIALCAAPALELSRARRE